MSDTHAVKSLSEEPLVCILCSLSLIKHFCCLYYLLLFGYGVTNSVHEEPRQLGYKL